jgi:hypothetical protein
MNDPYIFIERLSNRCPTIKNHLLTLFAEQYPEEINIDNILTLSNEEKELLRYFEW